MRILISITIAVFLAVFNSIMLALSIPVVFALANMLVQTAPLGADASSVIEVLGGNVMQWTITTFFCALIFSLSLLTEYYFRYRERVILNKN